MSRPRLFMEDPAGLAAVSLRLHGGPNCRPPISRMGSKAGYAEVILAALGLRSGQGAGAYLWVEADPDVAALLRCYPDAAMLRRVAEIIRSWADEEPRALWERLRAERKARGPRVDEEGTAGWVILGGWNYRKGDTRGEHRWCFAGPSEENPTAPDATTIGARCHTLAEYATIVASNRLVNMAGPDLMNTGNGGTRFGGEFATPAADVAEAFERVAGEVAGWATVQRWMYGNVAVAQSGEGWINPARNCELTFGANNFGSTVTTANGIDRIAGRWPPVLVLPTIPTAAEVAEWLGTPGDLEGVTRYADPPYLGTTGYLHDYPRADVIRLARDYAAMGAIVCISEAEPIPELVADGWHVAEITEGRRGQKRTFSAQKREYLTMNREPQHRVATQAGLFG